MPELPEVETIARALKPELVGRTILSADLRWARTLATPSPAQFRKQIAGQKILDVSRRAKYLVIRLETYSFLVHLRMSGDLVIRTGKIKPEKHDRLLLYLSDQNYLAFNDTRKFGRAWLTDQPEKILGKLGPEPLEKNFTAQWLFENLHKRKRSLKPLLLDQTFLAGLGNIYTDECLHIAQLHPQAASNNVTPS
jgi:formamidopyrimidine-DNA glycosylase